MPNSSNSSSLIKQAASTLHDSNRALLKGLLSNNLIKKLLLAEDHLGQTSKNLLLNNMDLLVNYQKETGGKIILILEHIPSYLNPQLRESSEKMLIASKFNMQLETRYTEIGNIARLAISNGIEVRGGENEKTNFRSVVRDGIKLRIKEGNEAFTEEITKVEREEPDALIIFLGGAAHIPTMNINGELVTGLQQRVSVGEDTFSWLVIDVDENDDVYLQDEFDKKNHTHYLANSFAQTTSFNLVSRKDEEMERYREKYDKAKQPNDIQIKPINIEEMPEQELDFKINY
ncbi:hypothetical protein BN59_03739 [Legionella massiliensis]|uniref:Uncharacterized protein n=1 Tax=Legionella massiliensis TaxID=1034943 RepID=A0A078L2N9_9GAMM|nr:hypothetical protein [Legionella massiliensis]CDZ79421.1 hypothetical protein BN59_03739 [Legionella massiliensis]CEE15159.1 hypothetical protein BN1094_03739 [Legionella massiliensis]